MFKVIESDITKSGRALSIFNRDMALFIKNWNNTQGLKNRLQSAFTNPNVITQHDLTQINEYNKAISSGVSKQTAFYRCLGDSSIAVQNLAANARYGTINTEGLVVVTEELTLAQRASAVASKALAVGLNLIGNVAFAMAISFIITKVTELVNKEKELAESIKETADKAKEQTENIKELIKSYEEFADKTAYTAEEKEHLKSIQEQLVELYHGEAEGIDLVNGKYDEQIEKLKEISAEKLKDNERALVIARNQAKQESGGSSLSNNGFNRQISFKKDWFANGDTNDYEAIVSALKENGIATTTLSKNKSRVNYLYGNAEYRAEQVRKTIEVLEKYGYTNIAMYTELNTLLQDLQEKIDAENSATFNLADNMYQQFLLTDTGSLKNVKENGKEAYLVWRDGLLKSANGDNELQTVLMDLAEQQFPDYAKYFENLNKAEIKFGVNQSNDSFNALKKSLLEQLTNEQLEIAIQIPDLFSNGSFDGTLKSITDRIESWNKTNGNLEVKFNYAEYSEQVDDIVKNIDTLQSALDNLTGGKSLEAKDITELANSFPDYSTKILSAANSTEELKLVLTDIKRNAPKSLINTLENLSGLSKQDQEAVNGLISVLTTVNSKTSTYADTLADLETKESLLSSVYKEMHDDGQISISTYQKLIEMGDDYANMVTVVNGKLTVNTQDLKELTKKKYEDEIATLKLTKAELGYNIASNPQNYSLYAEKMRAIDEEIEAKEKAFELLNGFDYTDDTKESKDDPWKDKAEAEIAKIQHMEAMLQITHEQYIDELDKINQKYFANNEKYLTEFNKYDEEVFKGRRELAEKAFDDTIDGIEKEIDALEKLKDNASLDINAEGSVYSIIDQQILLYQQAIDEIGKRIAELEASGLVGIEGEIEELNKQKDDLLEKVYDLGKERTSTGIENEISYWEEMQSKQNEFYDKQIEKLKKQKELLEDKNDEEERAKDLAEKQLELRKAQIALEDARRNRNVLVYTAGGGYSYEADKTAIAEAEEDVKKAEKDLAKTEKDILKDGIDKQIDILEEQKDKDSEYYDTIIKLLEDMSGDNKVQSESNRSIWGQLLATEGGQKALGQIDNNTLQELLDTGFLAKKDGRYVLGEGDLTTIRKTEDDINKMLSKLLHIPESSIIDSEKLLKAVSSGGFNSLAMPSQSTLSELTKTKGTMVTNYNNSNNVSQISIQQVDVKYAGESVDSFATALLGAVGNKVITLTNQKISNAT